MGTNFSRLSTQLIKFAGKLPLELVYVHSYARLKNHEEPKAGSITKISLAGQKFNVNPLSSN